MRTRAVLFAGDMRGAAAIEFALVAPVLLVMIMGFIDVGYNFWARTILFGEVQKAARDSSLESGPAGQAELDRKVATAIRNLVHNASLTFDRRNYQGFSQVSQPEEFTDQNGDGRREAGECFTDSNGNGQWDADRGASGQGGADDVTRYQVTLQYPRLFGALVQMVGLPETQSLTAVTILRNQPYTGQAARSSRVVCV